MEIQKGDVYIFVARETDRSSHFANFELGRRYVVNSLSVYSLDEVYRPSLVVGFEDTIYAVYEEELHSYFVSICDLRNDLISSLDL